MHHMKTRSSLTGTDYHSLSLQGQMSVAVRTSSNTSSFLFLCAVGLWVSALTSSPARVSHSSFLHAHPVHLCRLNSTHLNSDRVPTFAQLERWGLNWLLLVSGNIWKSEKVITETKEGTDGRNLTDWDGYGMTLNTAKLKTTSQELQGSGSKWRYNLYGDACLMDGLSRWSSR